MTATELKPLQGDSEKQVAYASPFRERSIAEAETRLQGDLEMQAAWAADGLHDRVTKAKEQTEDLRAGVAFLKSTAISAAAWLDYGRHMTGHIFASRIGAYIRRGVRSNTTIMAFINVSKKASGVDK